LLVRLAPSLPASWWETRSPDSWTRAEPPALQRKLEAPSCFLLKKEVSIRSQTTSKFCRRTVAARPAIAPLTVRIAAPTIIARAASDAGVVGPTRNRIRKGRTQRRCMNGRMPIGRRVVPDLLGRIRAPTIESTIRDGA